MPRQEHDFFSRKTDFSICVSVLYEHLISGEEIRYDDVFPEIWELHVRNWEQKNHEKYPDVLPKSSYSNHPNTKLLYTTLKKAKEALCSELLKKDPACIIPDGGKTKKGEGFRYVGTDNDPLSDMRNPKNEIGKLRGIKRYVQFCQHSAGLIPEEWVRYFLSDTKALQQLESKASDGQSCISADTNHKLRNIELLPLLYEVIVQERVIRFRYKDFGNFDNYIVFHPQFLKEYDGRWQLFGETDDLRHLQDKAFYNIAIDRIEGGFSYVLDVPYRKAPEGRYERFFKNIVGVTPARNRLIDGVELNVADKPMRVRVRSNNKYVHGLVNTKRIFVDQKELKKWDDALNYGEFEMEVQLNDEFFGKILQLGAGLQIVAPDEAVAIMKSKVRDMWNQYE